MRFRDFLEEQTLSTKIAGYGPTADDAETKDLIKIKIENKEMIQKIYDLADKYGLDVERPRKNLEEGDVVNLVGTKENLEAFKKEIQ